MVLYVLGCILSALSGAGLPSFVFIIGYIIDSFNPTTPPDEMMDMIELMAIIFVVIGAGLWIVTFCYYSFFIQFSERVSKKIKIAYLRAILL